MSKVDDERILKSITDRWGLPLSKGATVFYDDRPAEVVEILAKDRVKLRFLRGQDKALGKFEYHPLAHLEYGDGVDYRAAFIDDVNAWRESQGLPPIGDGNGHADSE